MTDNGPCPWFGGIVIDEAGFATEGFSHGMRGGKIWGYENAHRVPCFIRWPGGGIEGGGDIRQLTAHFDILPSLIEWCGLESPEGAGFDGVSLDDLIRQKGRNWSERTLFVHNQRVDQPVKYKDYQVLTERWRLVMRDAPELYDILADSGQRVDLSEQYPGVVDELQAEYERWWDHISVDFAGYNRIVLGSGDENPAMLYNHDARRMQGEPLSWMVEFAKAGSYELTLYLRPVEAEGKLSGSGIQEAMVRIGEKLQTFEISGSEDGIRFSFDVEEGASVIQAWFSRDGKSIAPHGVEVRLSDGLK